MTTLWKKYFSAAVSFQKQSQIGGCPLAMRAEQNMSDKVAVTEK